MITNDSPSYIFKICLLGSAAVGKTCIARRLCFDTFDMNTKLTVGLDFYVYDLPIIVNGDESFVRLSIWDFGGHEQFKKLFSYYISGANGIFLVFDLINMETLTKLNWWYENLIDYNLRNCPKILVGTKLNLVKSNDKKNKIDDLIIQQFLKRYNEKDFVKTSSKENTNIHHSFKEMTKKVLDFHELDYEKIS